jgi:hypothetical protein
VLPTNDRHSLLTVQSNNSLSKLRFTLRKITYQAADQPVPLVLWQVFLVLAH